MTGRGWHKAAPLRLCAACVMCQRSDLIENNRSRNWCLVLYPDDTSHVSALEKLAESGFSYAACLHDRDVYHDDDCPEDKKSGDPKKSHWHVVLKLKNARWQNAIADDLGITPNYLKPCRNLDSSLLYLVHDGYNDRYQYDITDVFGPLKPSLEKLLFADDEGERVLTIVAMIDQVSGKASYRDILVKACKCGLYGEFRRLGSGVKWLIDEHNDIDYVVKNLPPDWEKEREKFKNMPWYDMAESALRHGYIKDI